MTKVQRCGIICLLTTALLGGSSSADVLPDPVGDATTVATGAAIPIDVVEMEVTPTTTGTTVRIRMSNAVSILPPSAAAETSISGAIEFDLDNSAVTGLNPGFADLVRPLLGETATGLGIDAGIDLNYELEHPGLALLTSVLGIQQEAPVTFLQNEILVTIPADAWSVQPGTQAVAVIGDRLGPTDTTAVLTVAIPEPAGVVSLCALGLCVCRHRRNVCDRTS